MDGDSINEVTIIGEIADGAGEEAASGSPFNKMGIAEPSYGNSSPHERLVSENWKWRGWKSGCDGLVKPPRKDCQVTFGVDQQDPTRSLYGYWVQVPPMDLDWQSPLVRVGHNVSSRSNGYPVAPTMHQEAGAVTDWSCEPYDMRLHNIDALLPGHCSSPFVMEIRSSILRISRLASHIRCKAVMPSGLRLPWAPGLRMDAAQVIGRRGRRPRDPRGQPGAGASSPAAS